MDINRLFDQHVQATPRRRDSVLCMQSRRTADGYKIHWPVRQESLEIGVCGGVVSTRQRCDFFGIAAVNRDNLDPGNGFGGTRVSGRNVAAADEANPHGKIKCLR